MENIPVFYFNHALRKTSKWVVLHSGGIGYFLCIFDMFCIFVYMSVEFRLVLLFFCTSLCGSNT